MCIVQTRACPRSEGGCGRGLGIICTLQCIDAIRGELPFGSICPYREEDYLELEAGTKCAACLAKYLRERRTLWEQRRS